MTAEPDSGTPRDRLSQRLAELDADPERDDTEEMIESIDCPYCDGEHLGELYTSPPDGYYIRYWCDETEMRHRRSYP